MIEKLVTSGDAGDELCWYRSRSAPIALPARKLTFDAGQWATTGARVYDFNRGGMP